MPNFDISIQCVAPLLFEPWGPLDVPSGCTGAARKDLSTHHSSRYTHGTTRHSTFYSSNKILFSRGVLPVVGVAKVQIMRLIFILLFFKKKDNSPPHPAWPTSVQLLLPFCCCFCSSPEANESSTSTIIPNIPLLLHLLLLQEHT